jgi:hypothetical protein
MTEVRPKEGDEKNCATCGQPAIFHNRVLKHPQITQIGDHVSAAPEYRPTAGWVCTLSDNHFEPVG